MYICTCNEVGYIILSYFLLKDQYSIFIHHQLWVFLFRFPYYDLLGGLNISCILPVITGICQHFLRIYSYFHTSKVYIAGSTGDHHGLKWHPNYLE